MKKIWEQINEDNWIQGKYVELVNGRELGRCAEGWIFKCYDYPRAVQFEAFERANHIDNIPEWNDVPGRTWQEVRDAFKKADL